VSRTIIAEDKRKLIERLLVEILATAFVVRWGRNQAALGFLAFNALALPDHLKSSPSPVTVTS
jgi:hypothetical protein